MFNLEIKKKSGSSIHSEIHHSKVSSSEDIVTFPICGPSVFMMNSVEFKKQRFGALDISIDYWYDILKTEENFTDFLNPEEYRIKGIDSLQQTLIF